LKKQNNYRNEIDNLGLFNALTTEQKTTEEGAVYGAPRDSRQGNTISSSEDHRFAMFNGELSLCEMQFGGIFMKMIQRVGIM
jgi:hypothetical protein